MMTFCDFEKKWKEMESHGNGYLGLPIEHPLEFHLGYHSSDAKSLVLMNSGVVEDIPSSYAIKPLNIKLNNGTYILEIRLTHISYEDVYLRLCWDMIDASRTADNPKRSFVNRFLLWQKLLQYMKNDVMSFQRQKGLLGELLYLEDLLMDGGYEPGLNSWIGPEGSDQDFIFEETWSEVKTIAMASEVVTISSLQQLDREEPGNLVVYFMESTTSTSGITLPQKVEEIRNLLQADATLKDRFDTKLFMYGYRDKDVAEYLKNAFRFVEMREYHVKSDFPRLTRNNTTNAVTSCSYSLSLAALEAYKGR